MADLTRAELLRIVDEFKSERDAAKRDAMRAFDERNILLAQLQALQEQMSAVEDSDFCALCGTDLTDTCRK